jgi:hypothetical protein
MAIQKRNVLTRGLSGKINDQLLYKQYSFGTVVGKIPDRSRVVLSKKQKSCNTSFSLAVAYAQSVISDPVKKAKYQSGLAAGKTVYHAAIAEFLEAKADNNQ